MEQMDPVAAYEAQAGRWLLAAGLVILALGSASCRCGEQDRGSKGGEQLQPGPDSGSSAASPQVGRADEARVQLVRLDELIPTPPSAVPTTAMLRSRSLPPLGRREQLGDIVVTTQCGPRYCVDGLQDLRSGRELMGMALTDEEKELVAAAAGFERAVRVANLGEIYLSAYQGFTETSGGAHANNALACATWDRRTGRQIRLLEVVSGVEASVLKEQATMALQEFLEETGRPRYTLDETSFLYDSAKQRITFCALAPFAAAGTVIEISIDRPIERR